MLELVRVRGWPCSRRGVQ